MYTYVCVWIYLQIFLYIFLVMMISPQVFSVGVLARFQGVLSYRWMISMPTLATTLPWLNFVSPVNLILLLPKD